MPTDPLGSPRSAVLVALSALARASVDRLGCFEVAKYAVGQAGQLAAVVVVEAVAVDSAVGRMEAAAEAEMPESSGVSGEVAHFVELSTMDAAAVAERILEALTSHSAAERVPRYWEVSVAVYLVV